MRLCAHEKNNREWLTTFLVVLSFHSQLPLPVRFIFPLLRFHHRPWGAVLHRYSWEVPCYLATLVSLDYEKRIFS